MPTDPLSAYDLDLDDPRLDASYVRRVPSTADGAEVVLVGVVHDHPSSVFRARTIAAAVDPTFVGLELPPLTIPAFASYASDEPVPPTRGGEFSAAIQATPDARHVGIDGPSLAFFRALVRTIRDQRPSSSAVRRVGRSVFSISRNALEHRIAAAITRHTPYAVHVDEPIPHECTVDDLPRRQAENEVTQVTRSYSLLRAATPPEPIRLRDAAREAGMASRLQSLRREGSVVAIVGLDHLDSLFEHLAEQSA